MRIYPTLPSDFLDTPYQSDSELLSRADLSRRLTKLYGALEHGTVAILHGRWGTGKTTFVRKWIAGLSAEGFGTLYFSAFQSDYIESPFVALNASLLRKLEDLKGAEDNDFRRLKGAAVAASKKLLLAGAKVGVKAATLGALSLSDLDISEELASAVSDSSSDLAESAVKSLLDEHSKAETTFASFRTALASMIEMSGTADSSGQGRLVFVIDELDRCKPDFALGIIETIKHFFDVNGLHFVLVANKDFLVKSVSSKYGLDEASEEYLDKFFNFTIFFEEGAEFRNSSTQVAYARNVISGLLGQRTQDSVDIEEAVSELAGAFNLTLRQIEKIVTNAALAYASFGEREYRPGYLVAYLCFLKAIYPATFVKIKQRRFDYKDIEGILSKGDWDENSSINRILDIFEYHSAKTLDENDPRFENFGGSFSRYNFRSRLDMLPYLANSVVDRFARL